VRLHAVAVQRFQDVARAGAAITQAGAERRLVLQAPDVFVHRPRIVAVAAEGRRPALDLDRAWAKLGGRMAYGTSLHEGSRRVAPRRDNLWTGAKPGTLPVQQVMRLALGINLKPAQALGLTIPPTLLFQAHEVRRWAAKPNARTAGFVLQVKLFTSV
jgi:putative tryptophan/tyrosine transport system substrate-binding protein